MATVKSIPSGDVYTEKEGITMVEDINGTSGLDTIEDTKPGAFVWLCASAAAIGGMLFGCKCNYINPAGVLTNVRSRRHGCHLRRSGCSG